MSLGSPAVPIYIVPDADLKKNGGTFPIFGMPATPVTGDFTPPDGSVTAAKIDSTGAANGTVLTANGSGGAAWIIPAFLTQAQGDVRYGQLAALNTWALAQTFTASATFSAPILASAGTASLPGYAFTGVANTGMFRESASNVAISTNGTTRGLFSSASLAVFQPFFATITDAVTSTATVVERYDHNSSGTPVAGYGSQTVWRLKSSTSTNQDAIAELAYWLTSTHASRASAWEIQGVFNAAALAAWLRAGRTGVAGSTALWLFREATGALEQVLEGAADSGGTGRKALTVAN